MLTFRELLFEYRAIAKLPVFFSLIIVWSGLRSLFRALIRAESLALSILEASLVSGSETRLLHYWLLSIDLCLTPLFLIDLWLLLKWVGSLMLDLWGWGRWIVSKVSTLLVILVIGNERLWGLLCIVTYITRRHSLGVLNQRGVHDRNRNWSSPHWWCWLT